jgi:hypothetical protein
LTLAVRRDLFDDAAIDALFRLGFSEGIFKCPDLLAYKVSERRIRDLQFPKLAVRDDDRVEVAVAL